MNSSNREKELKKYILKYRLYLYLAVAIAVVLVLPLLFLIKNILVSYIVMILLVYFCALKGVRIAFGKSIYPIFGKNLDVDTFLEVIYSGNFGSGFHIWQLFGEYYCGNYQNVIGICKENMDNPKFYKKCKYTYLIYQANVYFDVGDDENLSLILEQYHKILETENHKKQKKIRSAFTVMELFKKYLERDIDACIELRNKHVPRNDIERYMSAFRRAKLEFLSENIDKARENYELLAKSVPQLNYGKLAAKYLEKIESQECNKDNFCLDKIEECNVVPHLSVKPLIKKLSVISICCGVLLLCLYFFVF